MKEVKKDFYLTIFNLLKQGLNPTRISKQLNISKQRLNYYIRQFKKQNLIEKVGYGTWEIKTSKNLSRSGLALDVKEVRGHGFAFKIPIKTLRNWKNRFNLLKRRNIKFEPIHNKIIRLIYKNHKVWLTSKSIIIYFPKGKEYFTETSDIAREQAIYDFKLLCNRLFRFIGLNLPKFEYQIIKHHYSLIENELAKDYNKKKKKLILEQKGKVWGLIDNSYNLNEFETISKESNKDNKIVQDFFNDLKRTPTTISEVVGLVGSLALTQQGFDKNIKKHFEVLDKIGNAVENLTKQVKKRKNV